MIFKRILTAAFTILLSLIAGGCWNYQEINELTIVAGIAVDKSPTGDGFELTAEVIDIMGSAGGKPAPKYISKCGKSMFDTSRNMLDVTGKRLYWAHAKVIIISPEVAKEGMRNAVDWYERDPETRTEIQLLIAKTPRASDIFNNTTDKSELISLRLNDSLTNVTSVSKTPSVELWEFVNALEQSGVSAYTGCVDLVESAGIKAPDITGTAVFKFDKLVGILSDDDTMSFMFATDQIKGGVLVEDVNENEEPARISLEIFSNKTRIKPVVNGTRDISFNIDTETTVAIDEVEGSFNVKDEKSIRRLEELAGKNLEARIEGIIRKVQEDFDSDIFGFGTALYRNNPGLWDMCQKNWNSIFGSLKVSATCVVKIKNSAMMSDSILINK